ncbi:hypothetical protein QO034_21605 [Sedimentitalea sp. JM2-8]|uniref:Uncharacterized protein n=1 Tax=Sedimentitalea xiamensis TaxID=3050037 RepID=A0ABT7FKJ4_9RHOB|nr:hypothetical protein [Sedimentitalea xiamensis]MDK3075667.1 hypothetical protein [Sedimentitalea xiamensis]
MFRPVRTLLLLAIAFLAGVFYERQGVAERCEAGGGRIENGICMAGGGS